MAKPCRLTHPLRGERETGRLPGRPNWNRVGTGPPTADFFEAGPVVSPLPGLPLQPQRRYL